jgi:surface polysaccharide O-acyltransferase-like enzyme
VGEVDLRSPQGSAAEGDAVAAPDRVRPFGPGSARSPEALRASLALHNLRGVAIAFVLMLHSSTAYLASIDAPGPSYAFDRPPYGWLAYAIIDPRRWLGFDIFCAWLDLFLMSLMFFLSGAFVWPSLERAGFKKFLGRRLLRLVVALAFGVFVVVPVALYPVYRLSAAEPSFVGYLAAYRSLPFTPIGPMWFLWVLLAFDVIAACLHRWGGRAVAAVHSLAESIASRPLLALTAFALVAAAAYVPFALAFTPWRWSAFGPFGIQLARPLLYAAYFFLGLFVGHQGLGRGLLRTDGLLPKRWRSMLALAAAAFVVWMLLTWLALKQGDAAPVALLVIAAISYAVAGWFSLLLVLAAALRFGAARHPLAGAVADKALPVYVLHYAPVVWMQYALLGFDLPAVVKGASVFVTSLAIAWGLAAAARSTRAAFLRGSTPARRPAL